MFIISSTYLSGTGNAEPVPKLSNPFLSFITAIGIIHHFPNLFVIPDSTPIKKSAPILFCSAYFTKLFTLLLAPIYISSLTGSSLTSELIGIPITSTFL